MKGENNPVPLLPFHGIVHPIKPSLTTRKIFSRLGIETIEQLSAVPLARLEQHLVKKAAAIMLSACQ